MEATTLVNRPRLETLLSSLYTSLNKRLPPGQNISVEKVKGVLGFHFPVVLKKIIFQWCLITFFSGALKFHFSSVNLKFHFPVVL